MKSVLYQWSKRDLTPFGKTTVIKTLVLSKIVHILIALPSPSLALTKEIQQMFYSFLWNEKPDKIKRQIAVQKPIDGGVGITDIIKFDQSLKLTWIRRIQNSGAKWTKLAINANPKLLNIPNYGGEYPKNILNNTKNKFWTDVLNTLSLFMNNFKIKSQQEFDACGFMFSNNFKIGNNYIRHQVLQNNNIHFVYQLKNSGRFLSYNEFTNKYNIRINFLTFNSIISAIKKTQSKLHLTNEEKLYTSQPPLQIIMKTKKGASQIYQKLIYIEYTSKGLTKWQNSTGITKKNWHKSFYKAKKTTNDTKLLYLQFRILHNILTTNRSVSKYKPNQTDSCEFCKQASETIQHLLWHCEVVKAFWKDLENLLNLRCTNVHNLSFNEHLIIFGHSETIMTDEIFEFIILLAKFFIYRCKVQKNNPNINKFKYELYHRYCIEKTIRNDSPMFKNSWAPYMNIFRSLMST